MNRPLLAAFLALATLLATNAPAVGLRDEFSRLMEQGVAAYDAGDHEKALASFLDAEMLKPESYEAAMNAGLAFARLGDLQPAVSRFRKAEELAAQDPQRRSWALYNKGRILFDNVEQDFQKLQAPPEEEGKGPDIDPERLLGRAVWCLDTFEQALEADPQSQDAAFNRAQAQHLIDQLARLLKTPPPSQGGGEQQKQDDEGESGDKDQSQGQSGQQNQQNQDQGQDQQGDQQQGDGQQQSEQNGNQQDQSQQGQDAQQQDGKQSDANQQQAGDQSPEEQENAQEEQGDEGEEEQQPAESGDGEKQDREPRGGAGAGQQPVSMEMTEREARALLNLLGNEQVLKMRMPGMAHRPPPEKDW